MRFIPSFCSYSWNTPTNKHAQQSNTKMIIIDSAQFVFQYQYWLQSNSDFSFLCIRSIFFFLFNCICHHRIKPIPLEGYFKVPNVATNVTYLDWFEVDQFYVEFCQFRKMYLDIQKIIINEPNYKKVDAKSKLIVRLEKRRLYK